MIARGGFTQSNGDTVVLAGPLAVLAKETLGSFATVREVMSIVGEMVVAFGIGQPLAAFQSLLRTYQLLVRAEGSLQTTAQQVIKLADPDNATDE